MHDKLKNEQIEEHNSNILEKVTSKMLRIPPLFTGNV
jgi:hypothetical protein